MTRRERYDAKRRNDPGRRVREAARKIVAKSGLMRSGACSLCHTVQRPTIWHHMAYENPLDVVELCEPCHRSRHPRPLPQGGMA